MAKLMGIGNHSIQLCSIRCCLLLFKVLFHVGKARSTKLPNHAAQSIRHFAGTSCSNVVHRAVSKNQPSRIPHLIAALVAREFNLYLQ